MSIGGLVVLVFVRRIAPRELRRVRSRETPRAARPPPRPRGSARRSSDVNLAAAAGRVGVLVKRRLEHDRPEVRARQAQRGSARRRTAPRQSTARPTSSNGRVVPRPSEMFVPSNSTVPGYTIARVERRHVRRRHAPRQARLIEIHVAAPALHLHDLEVRADAEVLVEQARQLADRHAVPHRNREAARRTTRIPRRASALRLRARRSDSGDRRRRPGGRVRAAARGSSPSCRCRCRCACRRPADRSTSTSRPASISAVGSRVSL